MNQNHTFVRNWINNCLTNGNKYYMIAHVERWIRNAGLKGNKDEQYYICGSVGHL